MKHHDWCPALVGAACNCPRGESVVCPACEMHGVGKRCVDCGIDLVPARQHFEAELLGIMRAIQLRLRGVEPSAAPPDRPRRRRASRTPREIGSQAVAKHVAWSIQTIEAQRRLGMSRIRQHSGLAAPGVIQRLLDLGYRIVPGRRHGSEVMIPPQDSPLPTSESCPQGAPDGPDPAESP